MILPDEVDKSLPAISVILPVFNGEDYLKEAIDSILTQSFGNFELLVINDGSSDRSLQIIQRYDDPRIRIINNEKNLGLVRALNIGISTARGKYIARHDQDDKSHVDRFEEQYLKMEKEGLDICGTSWSTMHSDGSLQSSQMVPLSAETIFACLATTVPFPHGSVMMKVDFMKEYALKYDEQYLAEDYSLWIRFAQSQARFANIDKRLYFYRMHPQSLSKINKGLYSKSSKLLRRDFVRKNIVRANQVLSKLSLKSDILAIFNDREIIYIAMLAYRLPLSRDSATNFLRIFFRASMRLKLHILYTIIKS